LEQEEQQEQTFFEMRVVQFINMLLAFYNLAFIPHQFGFRIPFKGAFLALEIITILMYLAEIGLRVFTLIRLQRLKSN